MTQHEIVVSESAIYGSCEELLCENTLANARELTRLRHFLRFESRGHDGQHNRKYYELVGSSKEQYCLFADSCSESPTPCRPQVVLAPGPIAKARLGFLGPFAAGAPQRGPCHFLLCALLLLNFLTHVICNPGSVVPSVVVLEGSTTSYAQFRRWVTSGSFSTLSIDFQTADPSGLLLYADDGGQGHFVELKLVEGSLRLRLGPDPAFVLSAGRNLHDGAWHRVEIQKERHEARLRVDEDMSSGKQRSFGDHPTNHSLGNNFVYVGGVPSWYGAKLATLSLPTVYFEPRFRGAVRGVVFASEEGHPAKKQEPIGFKGVRFTAADVCEQNDPCEHGGACISTDTGAVCDCRGLDFEGAFCDQEKRQAEATFRGHEFLALEAPSAPVVSTSDQVSLSFKTRQATALLWYSGDGLGDFMLLGLKDGGLLLSVSLGSGALEKTVRPARVRFDDNQWHRVVVHRKVREISKATSFYHLSITADGVYTERGSTSGSFSFLTSSLLYVGGTETQPLPGYKSKSNFVGCLRKVEFSADSLSLDLIDQARSGNHLVQPRGNVHFTCQEVEAADPVTFTTRESYLALPSWEDPRSGSLSFRLRTVEPDGVLMYDRGSQGDFFALELLDGRLFAVLNLGSGAVKVRASSRRLDDGHWHRVGLSRTGRSGRLTADDDVQEFSTPGNSNQLDLEGPLFVGGLGATGRETSWPAVLPSELWSAQLHRGFVGCLRDMVVNGNTVDIASYAQKQDSGAVRPSCHKGPPQCPSQPCMHGGRCTEGWNRFLCDCSHTAYAGPVCAKDAASLSFDGDQLVHVHMSSRTEAEHVGLRFRSPRPNGLLLATAPDARGHTASHHSFTTVSLESARLKVVYNLGDGNKIFYVGHGLNDDQWHSLQINRRGHRLEVNIDQDTTAGELRGQHKVLEVRSLHVGAVARDVAHQTVPAREVPGFVGHMQHLRFNGQNLFEIAGTGHSTNFHVTAQIGKKEQLVHHPVMFRSKLAFVALPQLKAYSSMNLYFQFKTMEPSGLILYNAGKGQDFIAIELVDGHLNYLFNMGDGPRKVRSNTQNPLNDNRWHTVSVSRSSLRQHSLVVDDTVATITSPGPNVHLDLDGLLYLGGVRRYPSLPKLVSSRTGFQGCVASLDLNGEVLDPVEDAIIPSSLVSKGCHSSTTKCSTGACHNDGLCVQNWNDYVCDCYLTSFSGPSCADESVAYKFGPRPGLITLNRSPEVRDPSAAKWDALALGFITTSEDAVLVRADSIDDFLQLHIAGGKLALTYNVGSDDYTVADPELRVNDARYHVVRVSRSDTNTTVQVDNRNPAHSKLARHRQPATFGTYSRIQLGGRVGDDISDAVARGFEGVMAGFVFDGLRVLDLAAENDPRIRIQGDVQLLVAIPYDFPRQSQMQQQPRAPPGTFEGDDLVFSEGSGCYDSDDDDCGLDGVGSGDDLISAVYVQPTRKPRPPPLSTAPPAPSLPCAADDEDCFDGGSGDGPSPPTPMQTPAEDDDEEDETPLPAPTTTRAVPTVPPRPPSTTTARNEWSIVRTFTVTRAPAPPPRTTPGIPHVISVPIPNLTAPTRENQRPTPNIKSSADSTALVIGVIAGILISIVIVALLVYQFRSRPAGTYKVDEGKPGYPASPRTGARAQAQHNEGVAYHPVATPHNLNGAVRPAGAAGEAQAKAAPSKAKDVKDLKEWYV
ncbi:neurexin 1-like [Ornithodoros turicata]|uniref:neurexin 1-like n=1 Tax=Ornithodoros turicata TaxID=34597 RepID=UPI003139760D